MPNWQLRRRACQTVQRVAQATVLALVDPDDSHGTKNNPLNPAAAFIPDHFLRTIPLDHWKVKSFDPMKREVCVDLYTFDHNGEVTATRTITFTLPELGGKV